MTRLNSVVEICSVVIAIFLTVYYTFVQELIEDIEEAKEKIMKKGRCSEPNWKERYYEPILNFALITGKYFHLLGTFFLFQIIKFVSISISESKEVLLIVNLVYMLYCAFYFSSIWKVTIVTAPHAQILLLILFFVLPSITWLATSILNEIPKDLELSMGFLVIGVTFWFIFYPFKYNPLTNLRELKRLAGEL